MEGKEAATEARRIFSFPGTGIHMRSRQFRTTGLGQISCSHIGTRYDQRAGPHSPACLVHRFRWTQMIMLFTPGAYNSRMRFWLPEVLLASKAKLGDLETSKNFDKTARRVAYRREGPSNGSSRGLE